MYSEIGIYLRQICSQTVKISLKYKTKHLCIRLSTLLAENPYFSMLTNHLQIHKGLYLFLLNFVFISNIHSLMPPGEPTSNSLMRLGEHTLFAN